MGQALQYVLATDIQVIVEMCDEEPPVKALERRFALALGALRRGQGGDARSWERTLQGR